MNKSGMRNYLIPLSAVGFFVSILTAFAQNPPSDNLGLPVFETSFAFFPSDSVPNSDIEIFISVERRALQFIRAKEGLKARISLFAAIFEKKKLIRKIERNDSLLVEKFSDTKNYSVEFLRELKLADIPPGKYELRISLTDRESKQEFAKKSEMSVPSFSPENGFRFSSIVLLSGNPPRQFPADGYPDKDTLRYRLELVCPSGKKGFVVRSVQADGKEFSADTIPVSDSGGKISPGMSVPIPIGAKKIFLFFTVFVDGKKVEHLEKTIVVGEQKITRDGDPEDIVDQLSYIGEPGEIKRLEDATGDTVAFDSLFALFWKKRDPTQTTEVNEVKEEFYRRVAEANARFGGYDDGWRADFGKTYIVYGEPDEIERHPFDLDRQAYEIWYYYSLNKKFYFVDRTGDGTYVLIREY